MINEIKKNINTELEIVKDISSFVDDMDSGDPGKDKVVRDIVDSLSKRLKFINNSIPLLVKKVTLAKDLNTTQGKSVPVTRKVKTVTDHGNEVTIEAQHKEDFMKELRINENLIRRLKKKRSLVEKKEPEYRKVSTYGKISNRFFLKISQGFLSDGGFRSLRFNVRRSNINVLTSTYISIMLFTTLLSFFVGILLVILLLFIKFQFDLPIVGVYEGDYLARLVRVGWIILALPILTWFGLYYYPTAEQKSQGKRIDGELPFAVVHMGSIAGSGIEPTKIFKILALSSDYRYVTKEIKKILNQTNLYGYDLTTALRNVARSTPSTMLAELLNGMSITINSGGDIKVFLEKRAESLLLEYRLDKEKATKNAETFMDIYISVVISTPMILLLLLIMISVSGIGIGLSVPTMSLAIIGIVAVINIVFLGFLQLRQSA